MTLCGLSPQARSSAMFAGMVRVMQLGGVHEQEWENNLPQLGALAAPADGGRGGRGGGHRARYHGTQAR
jgi:hypothetical protein